MTTSRNSDFTDDRVQRIADATFNDEDGEGAVAEWWDLLASVDADLTRLGAGDVHGACAESPTGQSPSSVSAATLTATVRKELADLVTHGTMVCSYCNASDVTDDHLRQNCPVLPVLAALSVLEQQHADAEAKNAYWSNAYATDYKEAIDSLAASEAALQAAEAVLVYIGELADAWIASDLAHSEMTPDGWPRVAAARAEMIRDAISGTARAALAAASAAAEGDET